MDSQFTATPAQEPEQGGFSVTFGNNAYVNLEPDTREETDRLFNLLAEGGDVEIPLQ